jgi:hypothetical protein
MRMSSAHFVRQPALEPEHLKSLIVDIGRLLEEVHGNMFDGHLR